MKMNQNNALKVSSLSHFYGNNVVLKDISFELNKAQMLCVSGKNGSGKSTLLRLLSGIEIPEQGEIEFNGNSIINDFEKVRSKIGLNEIGLYSCLLYTSPSPRD